MKNLLNIVVPTQTAKCLLSVKDFGDNSRYPWKKITLNTTPQILF